MGESVVEAPNYEDKTGGETDSSKTRLEVSVSFGRFDNDSLSWEKFSTFSPNKYLEEVEKCATPGSVAEKKAYFEAHYKKIAARRTEQPDKEKKMETAAPKSDDQICKDKIENVDVSDFKPDESNHQILVKGEMQDTFSINIVHNTLPDVPNEDAESKVECRDSLAEVVKEKVEITLSSVNPGKPVEPSRVEEQKLEKEMVPDESQDIRDNAHAMINDTSNTVKINEKLKLDRAKELQKVKLSTLKEPQKVSPVDKERYIAKKKPPSPVTRTPLTLTPKVSKPPANTAVKPASPSSKKATATSLTKTKNPTSGQSKKGAPKSLHMSLSLGPSTSDPSPASQPATRRSLIMEKMGDKDIVKRAFKTFQNSFNQLKFSGKEKSSVAKQLSTKGMQPAASIPLPSQRNGGSMKAGGLDKKSAKTAHSPMGPQINKKAERQKELMRKVEREADAKSAEKDGALSTKEDWKAVITRPRQSLNVKPKAVKGSYLGERLSKSSLDKGDSKK